MAAVAPDLPLIERARQGDQSAFEALIAPSVIPAHRLAFAMLRDRFAAEDAVQNATLKAWMKLHRVHPASEFGPWFLGIVANECRTIIRSRWWKVILFDLQPAPWDRGGRDEATEERLLRNADLVKALDALTYSQRTVIMLRYFLDLSIEDVARAAGISSEAAKARLHRALRALYRRPEIKESL
jgi:RNA polymerase sigma-70 factor, ECF subfamily